MSTERNEEIVVELMPVDGRHPIIQKIQQTAEQYNQEEFRCVDAMVAAGRFVNLGAVLELGENDIVFVPGLKFVENDNGTLVIKDGQGCPMANLAPSDVWKIYYRKELWRRKVNENGG